MSCLLTGRASASPAGICVCLPVPVPLVSRYQCLGLLRTRALGRLVCLIARWNGPLWCVSGCIPKAVHLGNICSFIEIRHLALALDLLVGQHWPFFHITRYGSACIRGISAHVMVPHVDQGAAQHCVLRLVGIPAWRFINSRPAVWLAY